MKIRILLIDDHFVVRSGLVASLELEADFEVAGEVDSGEAALEWLQSHRTDIVLLDMQLPGWSGVETATKICAVSPDCKILIFSTFVRDDEVEAALAAGALGYLQKTASRSDLVSAIRAVAKGLSYLPSALADRLAELRSGPAITSREREVISLVAMGKANKEIAGLLGIADDTVKRHVSNVIQKLGVSDRAQATAEAIRRGIITIDS